VGRLVRRLRRLPPGPLPFVTGFHLWEPTVPQWSAVSALWAFLGAILTLLARGHVYAPETVVRLLEAARLRARQEAALPPRPL
jgi:hypothetical protein